MRLSFFSVLILILISQVLTACGKSGFKAESATAWLEKKETSKPDLSPENLNSDPGDLMALDNEQEEEYGDPFSDVNQKIDIHNPSVTLDLTPQASIRDQVIGSPQKGSLQRPSNLFNLEIKRGDSSPFKIINRKRQAFFGSAELVTFIEYLAEKMRGLIPDSRLLIGNLSLPSGGRLGKHKSHQNGLDADIGYLHPPQVKVEKFFNVLAQSDITQNLLLKEQLYLFNLAVHSSGDFKVDRIFVHPAIKKALCETARSIGALEPGHENEYAVETLRRLVRDVNHADHFHLRLKCTSANPQCIQMAEPPPGHGC